MAFLNKSILQKKVDERLVDDHPLLKDGDIPSNIKQAYLEGCVLATLMDDEKVSSVERAEIDKIGRSLHMDEATIAECVDAVVELQDDEKEAFVDEILSTLKPRPYCLWFLNDFENLLGLTGDISAENYQFLQHFGETLLDGDDAWRNDVVGVLTGDEDVRKWFKRCKMAANRGVVAAKDSVGAAYFWGWGVDKNVNQAYKFFKEAAEAGNRTAQADLGECYLNGIGVVKNVAQAVRWLKKSAEQGCAEGLKELANCYCNGEGVEQNDGQAFELYRKSATKGNVEAQNMLGVAYSNGCGVAVNKNEAFKWYQKAAERGHGMAQVNLGLAFLDGDGCQKDEMSAVAWFSKAAEQGVDAGIILLARCFEEGWGTSQNINEARRLYREMAKDGNAQAMRNLGVSLISESNETKDENIAREGISWLRLAQENGIEDAEQILSGAWNPDGRNSVQTEEGNPVAPSSQSITTEAVDPSFGTNVIHHDRMDYGKSLVNPGSCVGCGACMDQCPAEAIVLGRYGIPVIDGNKCVECGCCASGCPAEAILSGGSHPVPNRVVNLIVEQLGVNWSQVAWDTAILDDLGADSLDAVELIIAFEEEFGGALPEEEAERMRTVGDIVRYLWAKGYLSATDFGGC